MDSFLFTTQYYTRTEETLDLVQNTNLGRNLLCFKCFPCPKLLLWKDDYLGLSFYPILINLGKTPRPPYNSPEVWWESSIQLWQSYSMNPSDSPSWSLNVCQSKGSQLLREEQKPGDTQIQPESLHGNQKPWETRINHSRERRDKCPYEQEQ